MKEAQRVKCQRPMAHKPEFEGKHHCKHCERELAAEDLK
jgi:hypothetical protein